MISLDVNCSNGSSNVITVANIVTIPPTFSELQQSLIKQANSAVDYMVNQITPTISKQIAYTSLAGMLDGTGIPPDANSPFHTIFNNMANGYGMDANAFANLVISLTMASISLTGEESNTYISTLQATTNTDLINIANNFNNYVNTFVITLNASIPVPILPPSLVKTDAT